MLMKNLVDVLKIFIEKDIIPTMISIVGAITTLLLFSEENWIIHRIGKSLFIVLMFCIYFLAIQFLIKIIKTIKKISSEISEYNYCIKKNEKQNNKAIQHINEFVDRLSPEDKNILISFIENGNKILIAQGGIRFSGYNSLLENTNIMNISTYKGNISDIDRTKYWMTSDLEKTLNSGMKPLSGFKQYKIKDLLYSELEFVYRTTGKLGNF